ncbi:putative transposase [Staphylococcus aureus]|nr:putative transposase [Staphylococcus aureus]
MIFDRHANLKYRYGNRKFWCKGFYVDTVGRNKKVIENYLTAVFLGIYVPTSFILFVIPVDI